MHPSMIFMNQSFEYSFSSVPETNPASKKLPKESIQTKSVLDQLEIANEEEDTARLMQLIEEFRDETAPFTYTLQEPNIPNADYQSIKESQKKVAELMSLGKNQDGYQQARRLLELVTQYYSKAHPVALSAYNNVAIFLRRTGQLAQAKSIMITVYEGYTRVLGPGHQHSIVGLINLAAVYKTNGELDTAKKLYQEAVHRIETPREEGYSSSLKITVKWGLAGCLRDLGELEESVKVLDETMQVVATSTPGGVETDSLQKAQLLLSKGMTLKRLKRLVEAENLYLEVLRIRRHRSEESELWTGVS